MTGFKSIYFPTTSQLQFLTLPFNLMQGKTVCITSVSHLVMSMIAVFKLERLKIKHRLNHFALRKKVFIKANFVAMTEMKKLQYA